MKNCVNLFNFKASICQNQLESDQELTVEQLRTILDAAIVGFDKNEPMDIKGWVCGLEIFGIFKSLKPLPSSPKIDYVTCFFDLPNGKKFKGT